jgi:hypothetical protein
MFKKILFNLVLLIMALAIFTGSVFAYCETTDTFESGSTYCDGGGSAKCYTSTYTWCTNPDCTGCSSNSNPAGCDPCPTTTTSPTTTIGESCGGGFQNYTNPHNACMSGICASVANCGASDCSGCAGTGVDVTTTTMPCGVSVCTACGSEGDCLKACSYKNCSTGQIIDEGQTFCANNCSECTSTGPIECSPRDIQTYCIGGATASDCKATGYECIDDPNDYGYTVCTTSTTIGGGGSTTTTREGCYPSNTHCSSSDDCCSNLCTDYRCVTPTPTLTPVPTSSANYTVTGKVFIDQNSNGVKDAEETTCYNGSVVISMGTSNKTFVSSGDCSNSYSISNSRQCATVQINVPQGYKITGWSGTDFTNGAISGTGSTSYVCPSTTSTNATTTSTASTTTTNASCAEGWYSTSNCDNKCSGGICHDYLWRHYCTCS